MFLGPCFLYFQKSSLNHLSVMCVSEQNTIVPHILLVIESVDSFELIHSNIWVVHQILVLPNAKWFLTFIEDFIHITWIFLMKENFEIFSLFIKLFCMIHSWFWKSVKCVHTDYGRGHVKPSHVLFENGVVHERKCVDTQQKYIFEKKIGTSLKWLGSFFSKCLSLSLIRGRLSLPASLTNYPCVFWMLLVLLNLYHLSFYLFILSSLQILHFWVCCIFVHFNS